MKQLAQNLLLIIFSSLVFRSCGYCEPTMNTTTTNDSDTNYERSRQDTAFGFSFLEVIGIPEIGRFYCDNIVPWIVFGISLFHNFTVSVKLYKLTTDHMDVAQIFINQNG